jgi:hypothetical protein
LLESVRKQLQRQTNFHIPEPTITNPAQ